MSVPELLTTVYQVSDEALALQVARGSTPALEALYDRHAPTVLAIALKVMGDRAQAEDILQETFWRVWKSADTYQAQRGAFTGWLFRIARNLAIDAYRRGQVRPQAVSEAEASEPLLERMPDPEQNVADQVQSEIKRKQIQAALAQLPREQRQVLELAYFQGLTRQEIAAATGEAVGTIHTRARLGLQKLRIELESDEFEG